VTRHIRSSDSRILTRKCCDRFRSVGAYWVLSQLALCSPYSRAGDYFPHIGKKAIGTLRQLAANGGYVCATHYPKPQYLVGKVHPSSPIELLSGLWGSRYPELKGRHTVMKTIRLEQARWVEPAERVTLHVGHPQQGTINRWHLGELTVRNLVEDIQTEPRLENLTPPQQGSDVR
jgi:hypothetical protein